MGLVVNAMVALLTISIFIEMVLDDSGLSHRHGRSTIVILAVRHMAPSIMLGSSLHFFVGKPIAS